jgi:DNA-binding response OmpR family regulator
MKRILLVEDDEMIAHMLAKAIRSWGYEVLHAAGSRDAVKIASRCGDGIVMVICDVVLRDGYGPAVAAAVRTWCPQTLTVFTSGYPFEILMERGLLTDEAFCNGAEYLQKPFLPRDLREIIDASLEKVTDPGIFLAGGAR